MKENELEEKKVTVVIGLGFGDEGKGTVVDALTARHNGETTILKFSGGPQSAHNVITDDGRHHTFSQIGAGAFHGAKTIISAECMFNPFNYIAEAAAFKKVMPSFDPYADVAVSENSLLLTPIHQAINRALEDARGDKRHGSCGQGIGVAKSFRLAFPGGAPIMQDIHDPVLLAWKLSELVRWAQDADILQSFPQASLKSLAAEYKDFSKLLKVVYDDEITEKLESADNIICEGSQGVLLDESLGFAPHNTWTDVTPAKAFEELEWAHYNYEDVKVIGVTRSYHTRHGAGPFPTEGFGKERMSVPRDLHNAWGEYQGDFRTGALDVKLLAYALDAVEPDEIAVTHADAEMVMVSETYKQDPSIAIARDLEDIWIRDQKQGMERLTEELFKAEPDETQAWWMGWHEEAKCGIEEGMDNILDDLTNAKVTILSHGPKTGDKTFK